MILETAQLLCNGYRSLFASFDDSALSCLYKPTHNNHPCSVFVRDNPNNYAWTLDLFTELHKEKIYRTHTGHKSYTQLYLTLVKPVNLPSVLPLPSFSFNCSGFNSGNVFDDYKQCLLQKWNNDKAPPSWGRRGAPTWMQ